MAAIIFDLDGTLLDTVPDIQASINVALDHAGAAPLDARTVRSFVGEGTTVFVERTLQARNLPIGEFDALHEDFLAQYRTATQRTEPYAGMIDALDAITAAGHRLGLCTNKPAAATAHVLERFDLARRMVSVVAGDTLALRKPDPAPMRHAMEEMGADFCLYVGDSETDAATARAAGQDFVLHVHGYRRSAAEEISAIARFGNFADLPAIVETWEKRRDI
ncbi:phosphoglycolate phosphatase [Palleronia aestuarii]|uniref:phosphoglycolate phosphatase n=1 Tax=Palleronia aestuarii TaxID=568105 RepID=A0A2W7P2Z8_9RHOB|nr:phosphoglycolate phosphatase [Palleronia aestuarii]PZX17802.1 phosphoglycolate phosphatase [Palleronia aestuarii]